MNGDSDSAGVRFPPPFLYLGAMLAGLAADRALEGTRASGLGIVRPMQLGLGVGLIVAGLVLGGSAVLLFRQAGTSEKPWETSTAIVTRGPYRFTRNPMYVGMTLVYLGLVLVFDAPVALLLLPVVLIVMQTQVIAREERYLACKFGAGYEDYRRRVRRWL